jgi:hypothetical protein
MSILPAEKNCASSGYFIGVALECDRTRDQERIACFARARRGVRYKNRSQVPPAVTVADQICDRHALKQGYERKRSTPLRPHTT